MEAFVNSCLLVFGSEMGDKTQLLALMLTARFHKPWTILAGILVATVLNHALASVIGAWLSSLLEPEALRWALALTFFGFAAWILIPDKEGVTKAKPGLGVFLTTVIAFFLAEMGDKTQLATVALAARYSDPWLVTLGSTLGMLAANGIAVFLGEQLLTRIPMRVVRRAASALFFLFGLWILFGS